VSSDAPDEQPLDSIITRALFQSDASRNMAGSRRKHGRFQDWKADRHRFTRFNLPKHLSACPKKPVEIGGSATSRLLKIAAISAVLLGQLVVFRLRSGHHIAISRDPQDRHAGTAW